MAGPVTLLQLIRPKEKGQSHGTKSSADSFYANDAMTGILPLDSAEAQQHLDQLNAWSMVYVLHAPSLPWPHEQMLFALLAGIGPVEEIACLETARLLEKELVARWQAQGGEMATLPPERWYHRQAEIEAEQEREWFRSYGIAIDDSRFYDRSRFRYVLRS